jgi:integrase/recombinase XerD
VTEERTTPLRQRMIDDMRIRGMGDKAQQAHIRAIKDFAVFIKRSPDTATPEDLRAYQLHMTDTGVTPSTFNARIVALARCRSLRRAIGATVPSNSSA